MYALTLGHLQRFHVFDLKTETVLWIRNGVRCTLSHHDDRTTTTGQRSAQTALGFPGRLRQHPSLARLHSNTRRTSGRQDTANGPTKGTAEERNRTAPRRSSKTTQGQANKERVPPLDARAESRAEPEAAAAVQRSAGSNRRPRFERVNVPAYPALIGISTYTKPRPNVAGVSPSVNDSVTSAASEALRASMT